MHRRQRPVGHRDPACPQVAFYLPDAQPAEVEDPSGQQHRCVAFYHGLVEMLQGIGPAGAPPEATTGRDTACRCTDGQTEWGCPASRRG
jgi:hypothetical protein